MFECVFMLGVLFFFIGVITLLSPAPGERGSLAANPLPPMRYSPANNTAGAASLQQAGAAGTLNRAVGGNMPASPSLDKIRIGNQIRVRHPVQGELTVHVMGRIIYDELWQAQRGPQVPWTPTGSAFSGFWLETNVFLLNWQNRYYLLDEASYLSDADIQRDFAPHARKFAQSDQTADVYFAYPPASWHIDDIGKFRIRQVEGEGLRNVPGSIGRFVHCSGDGQRGLVLEDFETGGGQDVVWTGYLIQAEDIIS